MNERSGRVLISVVLSFRNEAENIPTLIARLDKMFVAEGVQYELLFVNDASTDSSASILLKERERNPGVKILNMARRFGVAECVLAGMAAARGDAVVYMDADLQDPPEVIPTLLAKWRAGADVVHTVRTKRHGENPLKMLATRLAYQIIHLGSTLQLPINAGDFKLLSRSAVDHLLQLPESDPYMRGLVVWIGMNQVLVPYERDARHAGRTHFPFFSRNPWKTFILGVTSFTFLPIYICVVLAMLGLIVSASLVLGTFVVFLSGVKVSGTMALASLIAFLWAVTMSGIAMIGLYVIRIYKDVRGRPPYIVQSTVGVTAGTQAGRNTVGSRE